MEAYPPRCKKGLRSFYWMYNVYRRFVKDYAQVAQPLAAMMSCKRPDWLGSLPDDALGAFKELKRRLKEALILPLSTAAPGGPHVGLGRRCETSRRGPTAGTAQAIPSARGPLEPLS